MPTINFHMEPQEHLNWCWAAVAVSVDRFFDRGSKWCQCRMASRMAKIRRLKVKNCATCGKPKPVPETCNRPWFLDQALQLAGRLKGKPKKTRLSFSQIQRKIEAGQPVCVRVQWGRGPDAHFVVISGCEVSSSGERWVDVEDSVAGSSTWLFDEFRSNYQYSQGNWDVTYPV